MYDFIQDLMMESMEIKAISGWLIYRPDSVNGLKLIVKPFSDL